MPTMGQTHWKKILVQRGGETTWFLPSSSSLSTEERQHEPRSSGIKKKLCAEMFNLVYNCKRKLCGSIFHQHFSRWRGGTGWIVVHRRSCTVGVAEVGKMPTHWKLQGTWLAGGQPLHPPNSILRPGAQESVSCLTWVRMEAQNN